MSSQLSSLFANQKFLGTYLFGLVIIVLYAKDKFNMPTYDRTAMGPFAQLPPQSLTLDRSYRQGRTTYIVMLLCLYTAVCVVGPTTFPDLFTFMKNVAPQYQLGVQSDNAELWPIAAATFLISTGAMSDGSILGKIEFFVRQYAHKTAYIPRTVRDLARSLRETDVLKWLGEPGDVSLAQEVKDRRKARLIALAGAGAVNDVIAKGEHASEEMIRWLRANILLITLDGLFGKRFETVEGRLDELTDLPANKEVYTSITGTQSALYKNLVDADGNFQSEKGDAARFAKDSSLMLAVLLSQGARNQAELDDYLKRFGLEEAHFHPTDASTFVTTVNVCLCLGVAGAALVFALGYVTPGLRWLFDLSGSATNPSKDLAELAQSVDVFPWLATLVSAVLSYLIAFRVLVYCRDEAMETREWIENLASGIRVVAIASSVSTIMSFVALVLFYTIVGKLENVLNEPSIVISLLATQFLLSLLLSCFGLIYLRAAPTLPFVLDEVRPRLWARFAVCIRMPEPWVHATLAAALVIMVLVLSTLNQRSKLIDQIRQNYDQSLGGLFTNQTWLKGKLVELATTGPDLPAEVKKRISDDAEAAVVAAYDTMTLIPKGPIWDVDQMRSADAFPRPCMPSGMASSYTQESLCHLATVCQTLNKVRLSAAPDPSSFQEPKCSPNQQSPNKSGVGSNVPPGQRTSGTPDSTAKPPAPGPATTSPPAPHAGPVSPRNPDPAADTVTPAPAENEPPGDALGTEPPPPVPYSLFQDAKTCKPYVRSTSVCGEKPYLGLGRSLNGLYQSLNNFDNFSRGRYAMLATPAVAAFLVAWSFGIGCLLRRANWLQEGLGSAQARRLFNELTTIRNMSQDEIKQFLVTPSNAIGKLTPLEALRYEEFSIKLLDVVKASKPSRASAQSDTDPQDEQKPG